MLINNETDARAYGLAMARAWHSFDQNRASRARMQTEFDWLDVNLFSSEGVRYWGHAVNVFYGEIEALDSAFL
mgnify:CR=1 FL=1